LHFQVTQQQFQVVLVRLQVLLLDQPVQALEVDEVALPGHHAEGVLQILDLTQRKEVLKRNVVHTLVGAVHLHVVKSLLEHFLRVDQLQHGQLQQLVRVGLVLVLELTLVVLSESRVDARLGPVLHPLAHKDLVLLGVELAALALLQVVNPVALLVVAVAAGEHALACFLAVVPLALVDVAVGLDQPAFPVHDVFEPVTVLAGAIFHP